MSLALIAWSLTIAALIHIFEEFVFPGGFKAWWMAYRPEIAASVTNRLLFNVAFATQARRGNGAAAWLALAALLAGNAVFHIIGSIQTRRYSPGMVSGILLYIPLAIYGYFYFLRNGWVSVPAALVATILGGFLLLHLRRQSPTPGRRKPKRCLTITSEGDVNLNLDCLVTDYQLSVIRKSERIQTRYANPWEDSSLGRRCRCRAVYRSESRGHRRRVVR
ncbi:MAG TPA: HXXEE domain-containing protein [Chthoniobacterales bacterium]|jgi:hypothetical protein